MPRHFSNCRPLVWSGSRSRKTSGPELLRVGLRTFLTSRGICRLGIFVACLSLCFPLVTSPARGEPIDFGQDVRPLFSDKCFACHGPNEDSREGGFRLDVKDSAFGEADSGERPIVAGDPDSSELYVRIVSDDEFMIMPPEETNKEFTKEETERIRKWIEQGASWNEHWAYAVPNRPSLPEVRDQAWPQNSIDRFILARLEKEGVTPSREADRATLIRRVTFDLTGLPPTLEEIETFLADSSPQAYEKLVDRLLQSPHYGEHMGRYWLDAARYGDTHGLHLDNVRQIWPYREWVITAFNNNMPFDQFSIEQLAGDLLPDATADQKIATGFNRCNVTTSEGGAIDAEYHVHYTIDRVSTMSTVWMGASMGCVTCHDHKFDPFDMKDFYQLFAFFNSLNGPVMDGNKPLPPPIIRMPNPANQPRIDELAALIPELKKKLDARSEVASEEFAAWLKSQEEQGEKDALLPQAGLIGYWPFDEAEGDVVECPLDSVSPGTLRGAQRADGKVGRACKTAANEFVDLGDLANFERSDAFSYGAWVNAQPGNSGAVISRMNDAEKHRGFDLYVAGDRAIAHIIHSWSGNAIKVETKDTLKLNEWQHLLITYDGSSKASGVTIYINGKASPPVVRNDNLTDTIKTTVTLQVGRRTPGAPFNGLVDEVRVYNRVLSASEAAALAGGGEIRAILATVSKDRTPQQQQTLRTHFLANHDMPYQQLSAELTAREREKRKLEAEGQIESLIWEDSAKPKPAFILMRGQYDKPGEPVTRNTPSALPPLPPKPDGEIPTRLDLARWLLAPEHPLTSRVTVNRFWQQYFGVGIVKTAGDFGSQGSPPSHPQLLDWLAVDFRESGWDVKRLQKLIVMSATYRQSSRIPSGATPQDADNRLLSRGPRFRLDAEVIRDTALTLSGLLVRKIGGQSVKPYQPPGIWKAVGYTDSNTANFKRESGEALYRRSLYTFWKRTAPPPTLVTLDAPSRETCTVRRSRTNTPQAALALMNDEQFVEASRHFAQRMTTQGGKTDADRASYAFRLATARQPQAKELEVLLDVYKATLAKFEADKEAAKKLINVGESKPDETLDPSQLAAWTVVANLILNLDETITKG